MEAQSFNLNQLKKRIGRHFYDVLDDFEGNPLNAALGLQDSSSVGLKQYSEEFRELHEEVRNALKYKVEYNYEGFTESVGVYRHVIESLKSSHEGLQDTKQQLLSFHEQLTNQKSELQELNSRSARYKTKIEILGVLEMLQQLPSKYEFLVSKKQFNEARQILGRALEASLSYNLIGHPKMKPLISYAQGQQVQLTSRLAEELKQTLFIETAYSKKSLDSSTDNDIDAFVKSLPDLPPIDPTNPESNSFAYIGYLTQTLAGLNSLGDCLDNLHRTIHYDLKMIVQSCTQEVLKELKLTPEAIEQVAKGQTLLEQFRLINQNALHTLATNLFSKLDKALEMQRALMEVARLYESTYDLDYVFEAVLSTIRQFLLAYIGGSPAFINGSYKLRPRSTSDSASRASRSNFSGPVFEFGPGDETSKSLRDFELLKKSLKQSIPGLLANDPHHLFAETKQQQKLEVVAPAHILNIRPLLDPSALFFMNAQKKVASPRFQHEFDSFLDTFLQQSFVPKLRESFEGAIMDIANDELAFAEMENFSSKSQLPIANCVSQFDETVKLLCQILDIGSRYRAEYADMLVGLLDSIYSFFKLQSSALIGLAAAEPNTRRGFKIAHFILQPALNRALSARLNATPDLETEFGAYFSKRYSPKHSSKSTVTIADLLDVNVFRPVALLITSIRWFVLRLKQMRKVDKTQNDYKGEMGPLKVKKRWSLLRSSTAASSDDFNVMNGTAVFAGESLKKFDEVVANLEDFATHLLFTLRADLFLRIVYYFDQMVVNRDFHNDNRGEERDPVVDRLQEELSIESRILDQHVLPSNRKFLLDDIAEFMSQLFILEGENITEMNESGQNQILTNIFAFQQMLTSIVDKPGDVDFTKASNFYELFRLNPTLIVEKAKEGETDLGPEELKLLLQIRHRNVGSSSHAFGTLSSQLSQLNSIFGDSPDTSIVATESPKSAVVEKSSPVPGSSRTIAEKLKSTTPALVSIEPLQTRSRSNSPSKNMHANAQSDAQIHAELAATRAREERLRELEKNRLQKEHEYSNAAQAEQLKREREALQSRSQEYLATKPTASSGSPVLVNNGQQTEQQTQVLYPAASSTVPAVTVQNSVAVISTSSNTTAPQTAAAPAPGAARSPLLNHRIPRTDSQKQRSQPQSQSQPPVQPAINSAKQIHSQLENYQPDRTPLDRNAEKSPSGEHISEAPKPTVAQAPRIRLQKSLRALPKVRVNVGTSSPDLNSTSPVTPDQPTFQGRVRTPSERALDAARNVRIRQLSQQPPRRTP